MDDILIFSKTKEEQLEHIKQVLQFFSKERLLINLKKCSFMKEEIIYLGFVISTNGLKMDPEKVKAILEWPTLENVGEVRSFHSLDGFCLKIIRNFSPICNSMIETMRGDKNEFKWAHGANKSFETLK